MVCHHQFDYKSCLDPEGLTSKIIIKNHLLITSRTSFWPKEATDLHLQVKTMGFLCKIYILHMSKLMQRSVKNHNVSTAHDSEHLHLTFKANGLQQTRSLRCNSCIFAAFSGSGLACLIRICFNLSQALWNQIRVKREHAFKTQEEASN